MCTFLTGVPSPSVGAIPQGKEPPKLLGLRAIANPSPQLCSHRSTKLKSPHPHRPADGSGLPRSTLPSWYLGQFPGPASFCSPPSTGLRAQTTWTLVAIWLQWADGQVSRPLGLCFITESRGRVTVPSHGVSQGVSHGGLSERTHANRMHSHVVVRLTRGHAHHHTGAADAPRTVPGHWHVQQPLMTKGG